MIDMRVSINWKTSKEDGKKIAALAKRANKLASGMMQGYDDELHWAMNLKAVHNNGCPLDLDKLAAFDDTNFAHDIFGIERHLDKLTGRLLNCFVPRCAKGEGEQ